MGFEWDVEKEAENVKKHGITFFEAQKTLFDPKGLQLKDIKHSDQKTRFYWVGQTTDGRILITRFTERKGKIRIFGSAQWRKFRRLYETAKNE